MFELDPAAFDEAKDILKSLVRIDTSNPPGNERPATELLRGILEADGLETTIVEPEPGRTNLVCRQRGDGSEQPLLLNCHLDVVGADPAKWTHPPFSAEEADGCIWGRGTIDMKGFATMALTVFRLLKRNGVRLKRDVIFAAVADEERNCELGSAYLVKHHPDLVRAEYVINEVGGYSVEVQKRRFYLIQVAERGIVRLRIRVRGKPGHSAKPSPASAVERAGVVLEKLASARFPHHVSETMHGFLSEFARHLRPIAGLVIRGLKRPRLGRFLTHTLIPSGEQRTAVQANLSNTANPTIVRAGNMINVVPSEVVIDVDGRTSPSSSADELIAEIRRLIGDEHDIELVLNEPATAFSADTPLFEQIVEVLEERDPGAKTLAFQTYGATDSRNYAKLGATCYGFYPVQLPRGMQFSNLFHGDDERIPVEGFRFGIEALYDLVTRFAGH